MATSFSGSRSAIPSNTLAVMHGLVGRLPQPTSPRRAMSKSRLRSIDETNTRVRPERIADADRRGGRPRPCLSSSACNPTSFRTPSTWRGDFAPVACRWPSAVSTSPAASRCCRDARRSRARRSRSGVSLFAGEAEGRLEIVLQDAFAGRLQPLYNFMSDLPGLEGAPTPILRPAASLAHGRRRHQLRRRAGLPVPMLVLHHHQRAGAQVALPHARRRRGDHSRQSRAGHRPFLHHRRQSGPQQELGADFRSPDRDARDAEASTSISSSRSIRCPPHSPFHRKGGGGGRAAGVPRAREHQSRQPRRREEEAEPHRRISRDAAGLEEGRLLHLCRLYPRLSRRHAREHRARHQDHPARIAARSARVLLPDAAAGFRGPQEAFVERGRHGPRHEQIRPRTCRDGPSQNVESRLGARLSAGLGDLLHARAHDRP